PGAGAGAGVRDERAVFGRAHEAVVDQRRGEIVPLLGGNRAQDLGGHPPPAGVMRPSGGPLAEGLLVGSHGVPSGATLRRRALTAQYRSRPTRNPPAPAARPVHVAVRRTARCRTPLSKMSAETCRPETTHWSLCLTTCAVQRFFRWNSEPSVSEKSWSTVPKARPVSLPYRMVNSSTSALAVTLFTRRLAPSIIFL